MAARYVQPKLGTVEQIGALWGLGELSARLDRASPEVGQHSIEILEELGFDAGEVAALLATGAVTTRRRTASDA